MKTDASIAAVYIPEAIRWSFERWRSLCPDTRPEALMFPTNRVGKCGMPVPMRPKNFMKCRIWPIADDLGIPRKMITFQVLRRTLATDLQKFGTLKDAQTALRHKHPGTTALIYIQPIEASVAAALEERTLSVLSTPRRVVEDSENTHPATQPEKELLSNAKCRTRVRNMSHRKDGSSGRTRTYNPPVNSCTNGKTANYRQLRLILKIRLLRHFQERLSIANSERDSLKKSPKYFSSSCKDADASHWTVS